VCAYLPAFTHECRFSAFSSVFVCMGFKLISPRSAQADLWVDGFALVAIFHDGNIYLLVLIKALAEETLESLFLDVCIYYF